MYTSRAKAARRSPLLSASKSLHAGREEVEIRQPERRRDDKTEHRRENHTAAEAGAPRTEPDRDQRLADRDDQNQAVTLGEVRGMNTPAARTDQNRAEERHQQADQPQHRPEPAVDEGCGEDQRTAKEGCARHQQYGREQVRLGLSGERVHPEEHDEDDQERHARRRSRSLPKASGTASAATNIAAAATSNTANTNPESVSTVFVSQA